MDSYKEVLRNIDNRIDSVQKELVELRGARTVLLRLENAGTTKRSSTVYRNMTLSYAVRQAVGKLGRASTAQVVGWLENNFDSDVNRNSVRTLLSANKNKFFSKKGSNWTLKPGAKEN
ncbi:unnamed protein product [marine sediment metagenome]|uniref:HTH HARE-type domain-containing protein n=1 Tax=marine sediment metagenome TaxID=412755 RepID=X0W6N5_9ZZZZ